MGLVEVVDTKSENMGFVEVVRENHNTVLFGDMKIGETFRWNNKIYLKYSRCGVGVDCAFLFEENLAVHFSCSVKVTPVNCKLIVEG